MTAAEDRARLALARADDRSGELTYPAPDFRERDVLRALEDALRDLLAERQAPTPTDDEREALALIDKRVAEKWGGPSMDEFRNDPPTRKHYAVADAILAAGFRRQPPAPSGMTREALAKQITALHLGVLRDDARAGDIAAAGRASADLAAEFPVVGQAPTREDWSAQMDAERERQIAKGYDDAHDREHGAAHLLNWAIDYARRGDNLAAATMIRQVLRQATPLPTREALRRIVGMVLAEELPDDGDDERFDRIVGKIADLLSPEARDTDHADGSE